MGSLPEHLSSLYRRHLSLGAQMIDEGGWQRPGRYTSATEEATVLLLAVGLCDISPVHKLLLEGDGVGNVEVGSFPTIAPEVGIVDLGGGMPMCRLAADRLLVLLQTSLPEGGLQMTRRFLAGQIEGSGYLTDLTAELTGMCLAGPRSPNVLGKLTDLDLSHGANLYMNGGACGETSLLGVPAILVRYDWLLSMPCHCIFVPHDSGEFAWDALTQAGAQEGLKPVGIEALRFLDDSGFFR